MKRLFTNLLIFCFAIGLAFMLKPWKNHRAAASITSRGDAEDMEGYYKWELKRLADPATGRIPYNIRNLELQYAATLPNDLDKYPMENDRTRQAFSTSLWKMRGPWNVGGRTRAFAADVMNEGTLLAGTTSGGMWRSTDSGKSWMLTSSPSLGQGASVSCLAQDIRKKHTNVWYYGSGECDGQSASATGPGAYYLGNGVYRSLDNGVTWTSLKNTATNNVNYLSNWEGLWNVAVDPTAPDSMSVVYAALINGGIYRSTDTGNTWTALFGSKTSIGYYTNVIVTSTGVVYVTISSDGPQRGIWRSADGTNFTNITPDSFPATYDRIVMGYSPKDPNQVYFIANTPGYGMPDTNFLKEVEWNSLWKYKYISGNGDSSGGAWYNLTPNLPHTGGLFDKYNCQGSYDMVVQFLPTDTSTVFIGGTDIFRSTTGFFDATHTAHIGGYGVGTTLPNIKVYPGDHPDQHILFFSPSNPYNMYSGCDGGLFKTLNDTASNVTWNTFDNGYITTMFYTVTSDHERPGGSVLVAGAQDNDCLFDNSVSLTNPWTKPIFGDGSFCIIADTGKVFYYENTTGKLFKTQMDTVTSTVVAFNRMDPIGGKNYEWLNPYSVDPNNNNIMYLGGGKYLWRNNNLAGIPLSNQWDSISTNWVQWTDSVPLAGVDITAMAVSTIPANIVYYGTSDRNVYRIDSANIGTHTPINITGLKSPNIFPGGAFVTCIAVDPNNAGNLFVVFSNYGVANLFYSSDSGKIWANSGGNLTGSNNPSLRWATIQHLHSGGTIYWVAASTGLYATDTLLGTKTKWVQQGTATIGNAVCDMVDVRQADGLVAVATHAHGVYTANITSLSNITTVQEIDPTPTLSLNLYPNPSAGRASISCDLPEESDVELTIFSETGKLIQQITRENQAKGEHIISIDLKNEPSGIYFCRLQSGNMEKTLRLMLIK